MPVKRRAPGQRLRRSRRQAELEQLERRDPDKYAELIELRRLSPQQFRKQLTLLIKKGSIVQGRTYPVNPEHLELLDGADLESFQANIDRLIADGEVDFRVMAGLNQEERQSRARPDWMQFLKKRYDELMEAEGRTIM